jgi:hypothetical protein
MRIAQLLAAASAMAGTLVLTSMGPVSHPAPAADHLEPAARTNPNNDSTPDRAADIADIYVFFTDDIVTLIATFAGPQATDLPAIYDPDVLYTYQISNDDTNRANSEMQIRFQFGRDMQANGEQFGIRVTGVPGVTGDIVGPVESTIVKDGVTVRSGLFDDPFFFDSLGFRESRTMGTLRFSNQRNFFGAQNLTAVVIDIPRDRIEIPGNLADFWIETARFGGNL